MERVLCFLLLFLERENIKWCIENINVVFIVRKGSMKKDLRKVVMEVFEICFVYKICLELIEWIFREMND